MVVSNLGKAGEKWAWMSRILGQEGHIQEHTYFFLVGIPNIPPLRIRYVGRDPPSLPGTGRLPKSGFPPADSQASLAASRQDLYVHTHQIQSRGGRTGVCRGVN